MRLVVLIALILALYSCGNENAPHTLHLDNETVFSSDSVEIEDEVNSEGVVFSVDSVEIANEFLPVDSARQVFENKVGREILFFPQEDEFLELAHARNNGLIQTVQECYNNHRPLILSPDAIWLTICQGVSIHVNENFDAFKNTIFTADKPTELIVRNDSLENDSDQWIKLISDLSEKTKKYTKEDFYSFFVPNFSTTGEKQKTVYQITLMEAYKKGFTYIGESGCGIPSIHLKGGKKDWETIHSNLDQLDAFGLSDWGDCLKPIIKEFINAQEGNVNLTFWQDIYKNASEYNGFYLSGWIIKFFPYIKAYSSTRDEEWDIKNNGFRANEIFLPNPFLEGSHYLRSTLSTDDFPTGIAKINLQWNNYLTDEESDLEIFGGFFAIQQHDDKSLEPHISWAICEQDGAPIKSTFTWKKPLELEHKKEYWSPNIAKNLLDSAIYDIKNFSSQTNSLVHVKSLLTDSLRTNPKTKNEDCSGLTIEMIVLTNGALDEISFSGPKMDNKIITAYLTHILQTLPEPWFPALASPTEVLMLMGPKEGIEDLKVRANSFVQIVL